MTPSEEKDIECAFQVASESFDITKEELRIAHNRHQTASDHLSKCRKVLEDMLHAKATPADLKAHQKKVGELWDADPNCWHEIKSSSGGGVHCTKCRGWFCY